MNHEQLIEQARLCAEHADTLRAGLNQAERVRKIVLAEQILEAHKTSPTKLSEARAETMARASNAYRKHAETMEDLEKEVAAAEAAKWAAKNHVDLMLSRMATEREEMRQYGGDPKPKPDPRREFIGGGPQRGPYVPLSDFVGDDR